MSKRGRREGRPVGSKSEYRQSAATMAVRNAAVIKRGDTLRKAEDLAISGLFKDPKLEAELKEIYKCALVSTLQNPVTNAAKEFAELKTLTRAQQMLDMEKVDETGIVLSPLVLKAKELSLKAAKLHLDAVKVKDDMRRGKGRSSYANTEELVDITFEDVADEEVKEECQKE